MEAMRCHRKNVTAATGDMTRIKVGGEWRRDVAATVRTALAVASQVIYNGTGGASGGGGGGGDDGGKGSDGDESEERDGTYTFEWDVSLLLSIRTALDT